jgi:RNA recognition motif-containing protein
MHLASHAYPFAPSYAYIEFASQSSAQAAVELDKSVFRGRIIKVGVSR